MRPENNYSFLSYVRCHLLNPGEIFLIKVKTPLKAKKMT